MSGPLRDSTAASDLAEVSGLSASAPSRYEAGEDWLRKAAEAGEVFGKVSCMAVDIVSTCRTHEPAKIQAR